MITKAKIKEIVQQEWRAYIRENYEELEGLDNDLVIYEVANKKEVYKIRELRQEKNEKRRVRK